MSAACENLGSFIHPVDVPELQLYHWFVVFAGLVIGVGLVFELISITGAGKTGHDDRLYTPSNVWLIFSGVIHCWIEFNMTFYRSSSSLKPQMDMYAAADFRYGVYEGNGMESGTAAMEAITALIVGPLCFVVVYAAVHQLSYFHPLRLVLCTMQIYGLTWFTLQPLFAAGGLQEYFSSDQTLFWAIAVGCNAPWAIFPPILWYQSFRECCARFSCSSGSTASK